MNSVDITVASRNKDLSSPNTEFISTTRHGFLRNAWSWMKVGAVTMGAIGLVGASAYFNGLFGLTTSGIALAISAICIDLLKPVFHSMRGWAVAAWVATAMSLVAGFSFQTISRTELSTKHAAAVKQQSDARAAYERAIERRRLAKSELGTLPIAQPAKAIQAQIRAIMKTPGVECDAPKNSRRYGPISKRWCPRVEALKANLAVAKRRLELLAIINKEVKSPSANTKRAETNDVAAPSLAFANILNSIGIRTTADFVGAFALLFYVAGLEIGSSRAVMLVRHVHRQSFGETKGQCYAGVTPMQTPTNKGPGSIAPPTSTVPSITSGTAREKVVKLLKDRGGMLQASQKAIGQLAGVSAAQINRVLRELADEGKVILQTHKTYGTRLQLAHA